MFFEVFVDSGSTKTALSANGFSGIVRVITVDMQRITELVTQLPSVEIIIASSNPAEGFDPKTLVATCDDILVPGGTLLLSEQDDQPRNHDLSGMLWYEKVLGYSTSVSIPLSRLDFWLEALDKSSHTVIEVQNLDPSNFIIETQKPIIELPAATPLFDASEAFVFDYALGHETDLQWEFSGLNVMQELDIWILANDGQDGGAALGMVRALRREYLSWTIRLIVFPASYTEEMRQESLMRLPVCLKDELDIVISPSGDPMVPRMVHLTPLSTDASSTVDRRAAEEVPVGHIVARVLHSSTYHEVSAIIALVINDDVTDYQEGCTVVALITGSPTPGDMVTLDAAAVSAASPHLLQHAASAIGAVRAYTTAVLAPGIATFRSPKRLQSQRILLTHSDTPFGRSVAHVYSLKQLRITEVAENVSLLDLSRLSDQHFDIIISGYEDRAHERVLTSLLRPGRGKLFTWNHPSTGIPGLIATEPYTVADALQHALQLLEERICDSPEPLLVTASEPSNSAKVTRTTSQDIRSRASFRSDGIYLLLGGIGSIGAHLALYLYEVRPLLSAVAAADWCGTERSATYCGHIALWREKPSKEQQCHAAKNVRVCQRTQGSAHQLCCGRCDIAIWHEDVTWRNRIASRGVCHPDGCTLRPRLPAS